MEEKSSLNNKYQKIDIDEVPVEVSEPKKEKVKKEKSPKAPKEPKAKKEKTPKPPKEEKVKEPKPPKVKKEKPLKEKTPILPKEEKVEKTKAPKEKKVKEPKVEKEKAPKVPKEKKEKVSKEPKVKKEKTPKPPKEKKEKQPREPLTKKDFMTIVFAVLALGLVAAFVAVKYMPETNSNTDFTETTTQSQDRVSNIQVVREGVAVNLVQTDIPDVFYSYSSTYELQYYQYKEDKITPVKSTGSINTSIELGKVTIPVTIEYVKLAGKIFGTGLFVANNTDEVYFYDMMAFQLVNLPKGYEQEGKALLLATTSKNALTQKVSLWPESFVVDLETGKTERFLKIINRGIDITTGAGVEDFCILTNESYIASGEIPFISAREYEAGSGQQDIFIKSGKDEKVYATDVYGKFLLTDGNSVIFMRKTDKGFDVIRKTGEEEKVTASFYGTMSANYMHCGDYIFNKNDGKLYNLKTGEEKTVIGYRMNAEMISISPDGKYLVMLGTVTNIMDYQVHVFNLETSEYAKYKDDNYSSHSNLTFINDTTAVYMVLDPNQGYEYVVLDVTKVK